MRNLLILLILSVSVGLTAQEKVSNYISLYKDIAVNEMHRSGIPASITLAQGMFESGYGLSASAAQFNNHFGIKCKKEWQGSYFFKEDDDYDKSGNLIASCFRAYDTVAESFEDHTNFLVERPRYTELFSFDKTDYQNWALGLERCGYATNPMYAERLIEIIERYQLWAYDGHEFVFAEEVEEPVITNAELVIDNSKLPLDSNPIQLQMDTSQILKVAAIEAIAEPRRNRINRAIILPVSYQRRSSQPSAATDFK